MLKARDADDVLDIVGPLRRYVTAHVNARQDADDVVQETLARVLAAKERLSGDVTVAYAIVVAKRIMIDRAADDGRQRRNAHRTIDLTSPPTPDAVVVGAEERAALTAALGQLDPAHRDALMAHVVDDHSMQDIAADTGTTTGSLAAQFARSRARARLEYILALRNTQLPTARCRPILLAISAADTRRQEALRAGNHLLTCQTCASISEPLLKRRSALAAVLPWLGLGPVLETLRRLVNRSPSHALAAATAVTALSGAALVVAVQPPPHSASKVAPPVATTTSSAGSLVRVSDGQSLFSPATDLSSLQGATVRARGVPVTAIPADEGFWLGSTRNRFWVKIIHTSGESRVTVKKGDTVSFTGKIVEHGADFAAHEGVTPAEGRALLTSESAHLEVDEQALNVSTTG